MRQRFNTLALAAALGALSLGCSKSMPPADSNTAGGESTTAEAPTDEGSDAGGHDHHGSGPHGGTVTEWGDGNYHVEFTVDHDKKEAVVYILGGDAKTPAP